MAFPSSIGSFEYRNSDSSTVDLTGCDIVVGISFATYANDDPDSVGLRVTVTDVFSASASQEYLYRQSSPIPEPEGGWRALTNIVFPRTSYSSIDWTQVSEVKLEVGLAETAFTYVNVCYIGTGDGSGLADCPTGYGGE